MTIKKIVLFSALSVALMAGSAAAQTTSGVNVSTTPNTSTIAPGTGVNLGTITLSGVQNGGTVTSLPITITGSSGGAPGNLSSCQLYNASGNSLTTGNNVVNTIGTGSNTFTFNQPLAVNNSTGNVVLTVRCNVASNTVSGSMFTASAGTPVLATSGTTTTPGLRVNLDTAPSVPAGSEDVTLANISLSGTGSNYSVTAIPLTITTSSGGSVANLTGCAIRDTDNLSTTISASPAIAAGSATVFTLNAPFPIASGTAPMLALTCDVQPATPVGSTFTISVTPGNVTATNLATGQAITPIAATGTGANGLPASTSGTTIVSAAGAGDGNGDGNGTNTPGVPNTGLGTQSGILLTVALAGLIALFGALYLRRTRVV